MSDDPITEIAHHVMASLPKVAPITLSEAMNEIRVHAKECTPAVAALLKRIVTLHIAGTLGEATTRALAIHLCDVGREFRDGVVF
jgi:hypothetical protein